MKSFSFVGVISFCLLFVVSTSDLRANGFRNPPEGAEALGKIGGKVAQIDDPSAIAINPANLTEVKTPSFDGGYTLVYSETTFHSTAGQTTTTHRPIKVIPNAFLAWPMKDEPYVFGLGVTSPFGQSTVWGQHSVLRFTAPWFAELTVINLNPTFATPITDQLSIGVGADCFLSRIDQRQFLSWTAFTGNPTASDGEGNFKADGVGFGGNLGITWKFAPKQRLALTYRSPVDVEYSGTLHLSNRPSDAALPPPFRGVTSTSPYHTGITFPAIVALGYGIEPCPNVRVEADVEWVQFSSYHRLRTEVDNNDVLLPSTGTLQDWNDIWTFGVGGDWAFAKDTVLRAGYQFLQTPIPDYTYSPIIPDSDKHVFSIGIGRTIKKHMRVEVSYAGTYFVDRNISNNQNAAFNGVYELTSHLISVSGKFFF